MDLKEAFPDMGGISARNLLSMKLLAAAFPNGPIAKQPVSQLPWGHVIRLLQMVKEPAARNFYIRESLTHGWSRSILQIQIEEQLHLGKAQNNFPTTLLYMRAFAEAWPDTAIVQRAVGLLPWFHIVTHANLKAPAYGH